MDTQTQIDRLIELAIVQRSELKQLVEQLPQLREHLTSEVEKTFEEAEPQLRSELEEFCEKRATDANAKVGTALEARIASLAADLQVSTQARFDVLKEQERKLEALRADAKQEIAAQVATMPDAVKEIVTAELARFPRAGEIDKLRKEFAEPKSLNPRGKWLPSETYNKLDLVTFNGDSYVSNTDGNKERPSRNAANWTLSAARGMGGGTGFTSLNNVLGDPSAGQIVGSEGGQYVRKTLVAGANITINETASAITIIGDEGQISLQDGTAAAPSLFFTNDTDTGLYRPAANTLGISVSGTQVAYFDENGLTVPSAGVVAGGSIHASNGNANNPSLSFSSDQDTGFFRHQPNELGITLGGVQQATLTSTTFSITPNLVVSGTGSINGTSIPASKTLVVTTDKLSALASTSSSELAGVISDETGSGSLVFANTPTLVTPNIGAATGTSVNLSGNATVGGTLTVNGAIESPSTGSKEWKIYRNAYTDYAILTFQTNSLQAWGIGTRTTAAAGQDTFSIYSSLLGADALKLTNAGNATLAGNLTVSGTGVSSFAGSVIVTGSASAVAANRTMVDYVAGTTGRLVVYGPDNSTPGAIQFVGLSANASAGDVRLLITSSGNALLGTTTDNGQKLQVAGTAYVSGTLETGGNLTVGSGSGTIRLAAADGSKGQYTTDGTNTYLDYIGSIAIRSLPTYNPALTLDSSQNATFARRITVGGNLSLSGSAISASINSAGNSAVYAYNYDASGYGLYVGQGLSYFAAEATFNTNIVINSGGVLKLGNAYQSGAPTATGYVTLKDSAGNTYKVLVGT